MRILFVTRKWPPSVGGMETYSVELVRALSRIANADVKTLALPGRPDGRSPGMLSLLRFVCDVAFHLIANAGRYDVVHFGDFVLSPLVFFTFRFSSSPACVVSLHGLDIFYGNRKGLAPRLYRSMTRIMSHVLRRSGAEVISNSTATHDAALAFGINSTVIPLGARSCHIFPRTDAGKNTILFAGRIIGRKGPLWFADNVLPLLPEHMRLAVAGPEGDASEANGLRLNPRVDMLGSLFGDDLARARREAICVVMPNRPSRDAGDMEGFGLVAPEASAAGAIVLASAVDGIVSAIRDGETGFLIDPDKPHDWANRILAISALTEAERDAFTTRSIALTREHYSWSRVANDTYLVYHSAIAGCEDLSSLSVKPE